MTLAAQAQQLDQKRPLSMSPDWDSAASDAADFLRLVEGSGRQVGGAPDRTALQKLAQRVIECVQHHEAAGEPAAPQATAGQGQATGPGAGDMTGHHKLVVAGLQRAQELQGDSPPRRLAAVEPEPATGMATPISAPTLRALDALSAAFAQMLDDHSAGRPVRQTATDALAWALVLLDQ